MRYPSVISCADNCIIFHVLMVMNNVLTGPTQVSHGNFMKVLEEHNHLIGQNHDLKGEVN